MLSAAPEQALQLMEASSPIKPILDIFNFILGLVRQETRFLLQGALPQMNALQAKLGGAGSTRSYKVKTLYLDTPDRTWSRGESKRKWRLRQYNDGKQLWFEIKERGTGSLVGKYRRRVTGQQVDALGLRPIVRVEYNRTEFVFARPTLRVTIDSRVIAMQVPTAMPPSLAIDTLGVPLATLEGYILEIKSGAVGGGIPKWLPGLKPDDEWDGSKSLWSLAALSGLKYAKLIAPSHHTVGHA